ncbi:asparagine synthetase B family protein [Nocardia bovistercoris]|uniref:asparagine synthase (glutamine-hydrolyzing) n=1 Tax=Nocardia bovistercoris TaxID=2785916 RepID=A0A931IHE2_9NOCA|nr:asparagine synthase-related protein [Nocardia bovistercoris]MBH0781469.1 asparagine synthase [Nocardia bovistercoris]
MSRWCAFLADDPAAAVRAVGMEPAAVSGPAALGGECYAAEGYSAVGAVTLCNAPALRARLGDIPPDCADAETLLRTYARFGIEGVARAEGMFALAITDGTDLVLIRDHVGARTLFYARSGRTWAASNSLRPLRNWPDLHTGLHLPSVRSFLTFAYLPGRDTLLRDVYEALPGRCLRLRPDGTHTEQIFWEPTEILDDRPADEHALGLRALLEQATTRRLPAGEPVGVLLSGGIDSSLVTALAAKNHDQTVRSYSIAFTGTTPNELAYSGLVAAHCHTEHRVLTVPGESVAARLAETVGLLDCPVGDPLTVPNLLLAEAAAADGVRVVLNGEGGDPVFGGPKNLPMLIFELSRDDPDPHARALAYLDSYRKCYADLPVLLSPDVLAALDTAAPLTDLIAPYLGPGNMTSLLNRLLHTNLRTKGAHHILTKVERLTAAAGVQGRSPLFDRDVIDYAFRVPPRQKLAGATEKWILKQAVRDLLPTTIVDRPKSGMRVPVQQWLSGPLRDLGHDLLLGRSARARGLFRTDTVRAWMRGEGALLPRQGGKLWLVLSLELWLRAFEV